MKHLQSYNNFNKVNESDLDNCTKSWSLNVDLEALNNLNTFARYPERADDLKERNKVTEIELKQVLIEFRKVS